MALSYCSTYLDSLQLLNSDMTATMNSFQQFPVMYDGVDQLPTDHHFLDFDYTYSSSSHLVSYNFIDPYLPDDPFQYSQSFPRYSHHQSFFTPEIFEFDYSCQYPKRQRITHTNLYNGFAPNPNLSALPEIFFQHEIPHVPPSMELQVPAVWSHVDDTGKVGGDDDDDQKAGSSRVSLSAQSIAARERRRKITEKTQKLSKLIPGGHRMNTAEMFQAASKYVKYLQAQVGVLRLMSSVPDQEELMEPGKELIHVLLSSATVHEKLYLKDKCLVPRKLLEALAADDHHILINEELHKLLQFPTATVCLD